MIAIAQQCPRDADKQQDAMHRQFLEMLPTIRRQAHVAFRDHLPEAREELIAEVVANAYQTFSRLADRGKADIAYPTPLTQFAIRQVCSGRRVGTKLNIHDVSSTHCQKRKGIKMYRLDQYHKSDGVWMEVLVEDRNAGPADTAAIRMDFTHWLGTLPVPLRKVATILSSGETTGKTARKCRVSSSRISHLRRELMESWERFQGIGSPECSLATA